MGLKSGSRNAGLDEAEGDDQPSGEDSVEDEAASETQPITEQTESISTDSEGESADPSDMEQDGEDSVQRPTMSSIPYKLRRDKVNEGREQVPYFLRQEVIEAEDELQDALEEMLGENVYKSDYREAAMVVAQRKPQLIAEVLREWGYDLEDT